MFEHADGNNTIEAFVQVAIVLEQDGDVEVRAALLPFSCCSAEMVTPTTLTW
jgi:hypothetical protein